MNYKIERGRVVEDRNSDGTLIGHWRWDTVRWADGKIGTNSYYRPVGGKWSLRGMF